MADFADARRRMVDGQVRTSDVTDPRLLAAMFEVPRERFVPAPKAGLAYLDLDIPVIDAADDRPARRLLKPMTLAKLMQAAAIGRNDHVLDVGCATGYSAALAARLASSVVALEENPALARRAREVLAELGAGGVEVVCGPLTEGWKAQGPYDVILLEGAIDIAPKALCEQLADGGRLVCIRGSGPAAKATLYRSDLGEISQRPIFDATGPRLPGFQQPAVFVF